MQHPKISIITPSFNQGQFLEQTILSVIEQNYSDLEYIIIDGGSTDNSVEIIKKYEHKLAYWMSEKDNGQSDAINKGLKKITGEIFNWINSDDYYNEKIFFRIAELFADKQINVVCGKSRVFGSGKEKIAEGTYIDKNDFQNTLNQCHIEQPATFFRTSVLGKMGELSEKMHYVMDKEWWLKYLLNYGTKNVKKVEDIFVNFRMHDFSKTMSGDNKFYSDYATLVYSLTTLKKIKDIPQLLELKYEIDTTYQFSCETFNGIDANSIERMAIFFLLKRSPLIFEERDFIHTKKMLRIIDFSKYKLSIQEENWLANAKKQSSASNWTMFKINRKLKDIIK